MTARGTASILWILAIAASVISTGCTNGEVVDITQIHRDAGRFGDLSIPSPGGGSDMGPPTGSCDLVTQSGCTANQKCSVVGNAANCVAKGTQPVGAPCSITPADNCTAGSLCVTDAPNVLRCHQFCGKDGDCGQAPVSSGATPEPDNLARCARPLQGFSASFCTVPCNPVNLLGPSGCADGLGCSIYKFESKESTTCSQMGSGLDSSSCSTNADCATGYTCIVPPGACREICRSGSNGDCEVGGYVCSGLVGDTMFGACCPSTGC
jgi:hypothetical protein